jgi:hypothetical protein
MLERCDPRCRSGRGGSVVLPLLASMLKGGTRRFFYKSTPARCLGNVEDLTIWSRGTRSRFSGLDWMQVRSTSDKQSSSSRLKMEKLASASRTQSTLYSSKSPPFPMIIPKAEQRFCEIQPLKVLRP